MSGEPRYHTLAAEYRRACGLPLGGYVLFSEGKPVGWSVFLDTCWPEGMVAVGFDGIWTARMGYNKPGVLTWVS